MLTSITTDTVTVCLYFDSHNRTLGVYTKQTASSDVIRIWDG